MTTYDENDLINNDYENTTTGGDDPKYIAIRDQERVNKKELYEVIYFCNSFLANHNLKEKGSFQKVEKLLRHPDASKIVMRDALNAFVLNNWNKDLV